MKTGSFPKADGLPGTDRSPNSRQHVLTDESDEIHPPVELGSQVEHQVVDTSFPESCHFGDDVVGRTGNQ